MKFLSRLKWFFRSWKYNWKKYLAILFASLGFIFECGVFASDLYAIVNFGYSGLNLFSSIWNFGVIIFVLYFLYAGNIRNSYLAYSGVLAFIFMMVWDVIATFIIDIFPYGSNTTYSWLYIVHLLLLVLAAALGIYLYIRTRNFISGRDYRYRSLRNVAIIFLILISLSSVFEIASWSVYFSVVGFDVLSMMALFSPLVDVCLALSVFFTYLRLNRD